MPQVEKQALKMIFAASEKNQKVLKQIVVNIEIVFGTENVLENGRWPGSAFGKRRQNAICLAWDTIDSYTQQHIQ